MDSVLIAGLTLKQLLMYAGIGVGVVIVSGFISRMFRSGKPSPMHELARCTNCTWTGQVSRHAPRCPRCNHSIRLGGG